MPGLTIVICTLITAPFLFPNEFVSWGRRIRYFLRNDLRKHLSQEEWDEIKHEFDDL
jgi:hypothetical protein